jgi:purine-binding chemotaxis protein CheW
MMKDTTGAGRIDWVQIHQRLKASQAGLARRLNPSLDDQRVVLHERARVLAREPQAQKATQESLHVVEFVLAHERYAFESRYVREICTLREFTRLPGAPAFVFGLINVRGQILSVIDIKKFFELPDRGLTDLNKVIILQTLPMELGILADTIVGMRSIAVEDLVAQLPTLTGIRAHYLKGVTRGPITVLDAAKLLSDPRIIVNQDAEPVT